MKTLLFRPLWLLLLTVCCSLLSGNALGQTWDWAAAQTSGGQDLVKAITHTNDTNGGTLIAELRLNIGPSGPGPYLTKIDQEGAIVWSTPVKPTRAGVDVNHFLTVEDVEASYGGYYVVGWLPNDSTVTFGTSTLKAPASGNTFYRAFLSESGVWQNGLVATFSETVTRSTVILRTDRSGAVCVAGMMGTGTATFGHHTVTVSPHISGGANEFVVAMYSPLIGDGWDWATVSSSNDNLTGSYVRYISDACYAYGTVWITGVVAGPAISFPKAQGVLTLTPGGTTAPGNRDIFIASASYGNWGSASNFASQHVTNGPAGGHIAHDGSGFIYVTGYNPAPGNAGGVVSPAGAFVAGYDQYEGAFKWAQSIPDAYFYTTALAGRGNNVGASLSGKLTNTFAFGSKTLSPTTSISDYVAQITYSGVWQSAVGFGGSTAELYGRELDAYYSDAIYLAGSYNGTTMTLGTHTLPTAQGGGDNLVARLAVGPSVTIDAFTPNKGLVGTAITLIGSGFSGATSVAFNGMPASDFTVNRGGRQIMARVPEGATSGPITVTTPSGSASSSERFEVITTLTDLVISDHQLVQGSYRNVTVTGTGVANLVGPLTVYGQMVVQRNGLLSQNNSRNIINGPGNFTLAAGADLFIVSEDGLSATEASGPIQVTGVRNYSTSADYSYYANANQETGSGLPSRVRSLRIYTTVNLTRPVAIRAQVAVRNTAKLLLNGHRLTLLSDADSTAIATYFGTGRVIGTATVQRYISAGTNAGIGYRHLAAPVSGSTIADLTTSTFVPVVNPAYNVAVAPGAVTPYPTVFGYEEARVGTSPATTLSTFSKGWVSPASLASSLEVGQGYTVNLAAKQVIDFVGTLNTGPISIPISQTGSTGGWHLLGNPYPAPIDWRQVTVPTGLDNAMYVFESTDRYSGRYRSCVNGIGNSMIAMGQGFFVHATSGAEPTSLVLTNTVQFVDVLTSSAPLKRSVAENRPQLQLTLQGTATELADDTNLYFEAGATDGADARYDAVKLRNPNGLSLYSLSAGGNELAINGLPALTPGMVVPLGIVVPQTGAYTLKVANLLHLESTDIFLVDALTGQETNLQTQASFRFTTDSKVINGRFSLRFGPATVTSTQAALLATSVSLYPNPAHHTVMVSLPSVPGAKTAQIVLLNALGQQVRQFELGLNPSGTEGALHLTNLPAGVYSVHVQTSKFGTTKRLVIE